MLQRCSGQGVGVDPDGHKQEVFVVLEANAKDELYSEAGCCGPEIVVLKQNNDKSALT